MHYNLADLKSCYIIRQLRNRKYVEEILKYSETKRSSKHSKWTPNPAYAQSTDTDSTHSHGLMAYVTHFYSASV